MATRNIVPRGNGEGQLGTAEKHWAKLFADAINEGANLGNNASLGYRQPNTAYAAGQIAYHSALSTGYYLECTTAGTTSAGEITPSSTIGDTVTDGTVTWTINNAINPVLRPATGDSLITANADLNDYITYGVYFCPSASVAESLSNCPVSFNFKLVVVNNGGANASYPSYQFIIAGGTNAVLYFRNRSSGAWGAWQQQEAIVAKSLGTNGYIKYASGLFVQWGRSQIAKNQRTSVVTLPISTTTTTTRRVFVTKYGPYSLTKNIYWNDQGTNTNTQMEIDADSVITDQFGLFYSWFMITT